MAHGFDAWLLSLVVFVPAVGMAIVLLVPRSDESTLKLVGLLSTLASFVFSLIVVARFDYDKTGTLQFQVDKRWIDVISSRYHIGVDGISLPLLVLSTFITVLCVV